MLIPRRTMFVFAVLFAQCHMGYSTENSSQSTPILHPFYSTITGKYGYLDEDGIIIINPKFDSASHFSNNLARVQVGELFGYINSSGTFVIDPRFKTAGTFREGLALASEKGRIEVAGAKTSKEALALASKKGIKYGYIDTTGQFVIPPRLDFTSGMLSESFWGSYDEGPDFSEGLAPFMKLKNKKEKWGFITKTGKVVIKPEYDEVQPFSEGFAQVTRFAWNQDGTLIIPIIRTQYHIDHSGKYLDARGKQGYFALSSFHEGLAKFQGGARDGYMTTDGTVAIPPQFRGAKDFHEGLAAVYLSDYETVGFIDHSGVFVIPPIFDSYPGSFSNGLARVRPKGSYQVGYIDKSGNFQIPPIYAGGDDFRGNLATVRLKGWYRDKCPDACCIRVNALIRRDGKIIYSWSEIADGTGPTRLLNSDCEQESEGGTFMFAGPKLFDVTFSSSPSGAHVFAVPYAVYDFNKGIEDSLAQLRPFAILDGTTPRQNCLDRSIE